MPITQLVDDLKNLTPVFNLNYTSKTIEILNKYSNLKVGNVVINGSGGISKGLNADKLDGYEASDLLAAAGGVIWKYSQVWLEAKNSNNINDFCKDGYVLIFAFNGTGCGGDVYIREDLDINKPLVKIDHRNGWAAIGPYGTTPSWRVKTFRYSNNCADGTPWLREYEEISWDGSSAKVLCSCVTCGQPCWWFGSNAPSAVALCVLP